MASVFYYPARCALYDSRDVVVLFARFVIRSRVQCFWREWGGVLVAIGCRLHLIMLAVSVSLGGVNVGLALQGSKFVVFW